MSPEHPADISIPRPTACRRCRRAFTLVEVLVVVAIISILISLLLPAVQGARESARRMQCRNNLANLSLALQNYHGAHRTLPPGTVDDAGPIISSQSQGYRMSWIAQILPYIDEGNAYRKIDFTRSALDPIQKEVAIHKFPILTCPSSSRAVPCFYAGVHHDVEAPIDSDNHGVLFLNSRIRLPDDVPDGLAYTLIMGEMEGSLSWLVGDRQTLRNTGSTPVNSGKIRMAEYADPSTGEVAPETPEDAANKAKTVGSFSSAHPSGANFALCDGTIKFLSEQIDSDLFRRLGHRDDGSLIGAF